MKVSINSPTYWQFIVFWKLSISMWNRIINTYYMEWWIVFTMINTFHYNILQINVIKVFSWYLNYHLSTTNNCVIILWIENNTDAIKIQTGLGEEVQVVFMIAIISLFCQLHYNFTPNLQIHFTLNQQQN